MKITSTEFQLDFGRYEYAALQGPVAITKNGRDHTVLISADLFELLTKGRIARRVEDLDEETVDAIRRSSVGAEHAALDELLEDWNP